MRTFFLTLCLLILGLNILHSQRRPTRPKFNFGISSGVNLSGFQRQHFFSNHKDDGFLLSETTEYYYLGWNYSSGIFTEFGNNVFDLRVGLRYNSISQPFTRIHERFSSLVAHITYHETQIHYLQIPLDFELKWRIFEAHFFFSLNFSPSFILESSRNLSTISPFGQMKPLERVFEIETFNKDWYFFNVGFGWYITPRLSVAAKTDLALSKKTEICEGLDQDSYADCYDFTNQIYSVQLHYRIIKEKMRGFVIKERRKRRKRKRREHRRRRRGR